VYNIGSGRQIELQRFVSIIEQCLGRKAEKNLVELRPGDVPATHADIDDFVRDFGYRPKTRSRWESSDLSIGTKPTTRFSQKVKFLT